MKRLVVELDDKRHQEFKSMAVKMDKPMKEILTELLDKWLAKERK